MDDSSNTATPTGSSSALLGHTGQWVSTGTDPSSETAQALRLAAESGPSRLRVFEQLLATDCVRKIEQLRGALDRADSILLDGDFLERLRQSPATLVKVVQLLEDRLERNIERVAKVQGIAPGVVELLRRIELEHDSSEEMREIEAIPPQTRENIRKLFSRLQLAAKRKGATVLGGNGTDT